MESKEPLRLPAFEKVIGFAVQKALEDWRDEALEGAYLLCYIFIDLHHVAYSLFATCLLHHAFA